MLRISEREDRAINRPHLRRRRSQQRSLITSNRRRWREEGRNTFREKNQEKLPVDFALK